MAWTDTFNTYEEACEYYGVDTPAQVAEEQEYYAQLEAIDHQDALEAGGVAGAVARWDGMGGYRSDYQDRRLAAAYAAPGYYDDLPF